MKKNERTLRRNCGPTRYHVHRGHLARVVLPVLLLALGQANFEGGGQHEPAPMLPLPLLCEVHISVLVERSELN